MSRTKDPSKARHFTTEQIAQFREIYFRTGNMAECERQLGISYDKCRTLAKQANADPKFVEMRKEAFNSLLGDVEAMLTETAQEVNRRVMVPDPPPGEGKGFLNPKPAYFKALVDWYKALAFHRRAVTEAQLKEAKAKLEQGDKEPAQIHVHLTTDDETTTD